jgi:molecular chaperone HscB
MKKASAAAESPFMYNGSNFFELLAIELKFQIDKEKLYQNYLKLQQLFHPDKSANKSNSERLLSVEYSVKLNEAYQTLNDDKKRAEYLLSLVGITINQEENNSISPDPHMLNEILEISEEPEKYNISNMQKNCLEDFETNYKIKDFTNAAKSIIKLQYLNKIF